MGGVGKKIAPGSGFVRVRVWGVSPWRGAIRNGFCSGLSLIGGDARLLGGIHGGDAGGIDLLLDGEAFELEKAFPGGILLLGDGPAEALEGFERADAERAFDADGATKRGEITLVAFEGFEIEVERFLAVVAAFPCEAEVVHGARVGGNRVGGARKGFSGEEVVFLFEQEEAEIVPRGAEAWVERDGFAIFCDSATRIADVLCITGESLGLGAIFTALAH